MPEVPICIYCREIINTNTDKYVVPNKFDKDGELIPINEWLYIHVHCYRAKSPKPADTIDKKGLKFYTLDELDNMDLLWSKPLYLRIESEEEIKVKNWSDLCVTFLYRLIDNRILTQTYLPIYNHSQRDKYFISSEPEHENPKYKAQWKEAEGFYIDTKYSAEALVKNLMSTLYQLNINNLNVEIALSFKKKS